MEKIVSLQSVKNRKAVQRGFREWRRRFPSLTSLDEKTRWSDLPDDVILFFAEDNSDSRRIVHDFLMGTLGLGSGYEFESLPAQQLLSLLDISFILIDQVRFECMRRLGWVREIPLEEVPIWEIVRNFKRWDHPALLAIPEPTPEHIGFEDYSRLRGMDQGAFLRKYFLQAVDQFREKFRKTPDKGME